MALTRKKIYALTVFVILVIILPVAIFLVRQQQDLRQRAANEVSISFDPSTAAKSMGESFDVKVMVNGGTTNVSYIKMELDFDENVLEAANSPIFVPSGNYAFIQNPTVTSNGRISFELVDASVNSPTGNVEIGTLKFKGKTTGTSPLGVTDAQMYATGVNGMLTLTNAATGTYTITASNGACDSDTGRGDFCSCDTSNQCSSGYCGNTFATPIPGGTGSNMCWPTSYITPSPSITASPTGPCSGSIALTNGCACTNDTMCHSQYCTTTTPRVCATQPTATPFPPTLTPTNTPIPSLTPTTAPQPTATPFPTATPIPNDTTVNINVVLPGIGVGAANLGLNSTPLNPQRIATVQVFNSSNTNVKTVNGLVTFTTSGAYFGQFSLGTDFPTGAYTAKVKLNNSLYKTLPGVVQITNGVANTSLVWTGAPVALTTGDLNNDNTLGIIDWTLMIACIKNESACTEEVRKLADVNDDGSVAEIDVQILQRGFAIREGD